MYPHLVLFNNACADGDFVSIQENMKKLTKEQMEFGFRLASCYDHVDIVSFFLDSSLLSPIAANCSTQEDNAFMSSFSLNKKPNKVTKYLLEERNYIPPQSILFWIKENNIKFDIKPYLK